MERSYFYPFSSPLIKRKTFSFLFCLFSFPPPDLDKTGYYYLLINLMLPSLGFIDRSCLVPTLVGPLSGTSLIALMIKVEATTRGLTQLLKLVVLKFFIHGFILNLPYRRL